MSGGPASTSDPAAVDTWFRHIDHLARIIGPRGSTAAGEAAGADYIRRQFEQLGLDTRVEAIRSATSGFRPYALALALALAVWALSPLAGDAVGLAGPVVLGCVSFTMVLEADLRRNPLRLLLPSRASRNVWGAVPAAGAAIHRVVVIGHIDTNRTPLMFRARWLRLQRALLPATVVGLIGLASSIALESRPAYLAGIAPATLLLLLAAVFLQADLTPHTAGANDNASGAGLLPALGEALLAQPLALTEVWLVVTGCEEVGCHGARAFFDTWRDELRNALLIVVDGVGGSGPCYLRSEGVVWRRSYDAGLLALADAAALERPDLGAYSRRLGSGYTEGLPALQRGLRAITLCGLTREGELPHWHQVTDTVENVDREALVRNFAFIRELLERIDGSVAGGTNA
jgi:hypothetical protein